MPTRWFSDEEIANLDPRLVEMLDKARGYAHIPFIITSGYRTREENEAIGGVPSSAHTRGLAVDLRCEGSRTRYRIVCAAILAGFRRIELADKHVHLDIDDTKPQDVIFFGKSH